MKKTNFFKRVTACTLVLLLAIPFTTMPQQIQEIFAAQTAEQLFKPEELDQMLAPIALYPDALLAQVLTAATYPLEVVEADRFAKSNPGLKGEALLEAAKDKDWEPSVKAMLEFPDVLAMMDEQLEWTRKLGDAFLTQQQDCMDSIQRLREKAYAQGNLVSTKEQAVSIEPQTRYIIIEPATPEIVYVPVYDPEIIYGVWWYPAYPPYYFYPRRYYGISFFTGVFVGAFWEVWGTWGCDWYSRYVYININYYNNFTRHYCDRSRHHQYREEGRGNQPWRHDPEHRRNVEYRDSTPPKEDARAGPGQIIAEPQKPKPQIDRQQIPIQTTKPNAPEPRQYERKDQQPLVQNPKTITKVQTFKGQTIPKQDFKIDVREQAKNLPNIIRPETRVLISNPSQQAGNLRATVKNKITVTPITGSAEIQRAVSSQGQLNRQNKFPLAGRNDLRSGGGGSVRPFGR